LFDRIRAALSDENRRRVGTELLAEFDQQDREEGALRVAPYRRRLIEWSVTDCSLKDLWHSLTPREELAANIIARLDERDAMAAKIRSAQYEAERAQSEMAAKPSRLTR
jgi:hypothetical protein